MKGILISGALFCISFLHGQVELHYENSITPTWEETIEMYRWMDERYDQARLMEIGTTDAGKPLHLFIISKDRLFTAGEVRKAGHTVLFINNGIHPGEPCGVDASLKLASGILAGEDEFARFLDNTVILIVPLFNVGGAMNRSAYHRANQNGPEEHGFRGNARNLDLNRDFIKLDAANTRSLVPVLREWEPEIFVDTHTSNGADYPYTITLINSHEQRHAPSQSRYLEHKIKPWLFAAMKESPYEMSPYIWSYGRTPESGIVGFMDYPRYTSGYASLFNSLAFTVETHMFKDYRDRVLSTWHLLRAFLHYCGTHGEELQAVKENAWEEKTMSREFVIQWALDTVRYDTIPFRGFKGKTAQSEVTGHDRLWYDRQETWEKEIPYYRYFKPVRSASVPEAYLIPQAWHEVIDRLKINQIDMERLHRDTVIEVEVSYIDEYSSYPRPYNGHFRHQDILLHRKTERIAFLEGDYLIPTDQKGREYLVQSLEADAYDSFFSWNFFDEILFRNEYFSPYIFEETAAKLLKTDAALRSDFQKKKKEDAAFAANPRAQLTYIYERSAWSEPTYNRYPVYRLKMDRHQP